MKTVLCLLTHVQRFLVSWNASAVFGKPKGICKTKVCVHKPVMTGLILLAWDVLTVLLLLEQFDNASVNLESRERKRKK